MCHQFKCKFISFTLEEESVASTTVTVDRPNAFAIMMKAAHTVMLPKSHESTAEPLRGDHAIYNKLLELLKSMSLGWSPSTVGTTGVKFVKTLSDCLWTLDPHHEQFHSRACVIPSIFSEFKGYNDWVRKKHKKPQLSQAVLNKHIEGLSDYLMHPWLSTSKWQSFRSSIEQLVESLNKYKMYLADHNEHMKEVHQRTTLEPSEESFNVALISASSHTEKEYTKVEDALTTLEYYDPVFLNDFAPENRYTRRHWIDKLSLQFPVMLYRYVHGSHIGTLSFAWKIPEGTNDLNKTSQIISKLTSSQSKYASRAMQTDFLDKYSRLSKAPKSVLRNIYKSLVGDASSSNCVAEKEIDERVSKALLDLDDTEIIMDLREMNGNPKSTKFDAFWNELAEYLEEITTAVDERRQVDVMHMPLAISVRHLRDIIVERLQSKQSVMPAIPSIEWIRLQFWPSNPYSGAALRHTGRFQVKHGVQIRQMRKDHPDARYVGNILRYVKNFVVKHRSLVCMMSVDDKAIVPVGEPNFPVSTGVRGHNRSLVAVDGPQNCALDHDFHIHGIVPSVSFVVDIPTSSKDSFFQGKAYVVLKDKVSQPSSPLRHSCELLNILEKETYKPILITISDGGPDHRITFPSVKLSLIALFRALDLDMLISVRTCPYQSWTNLAERVMSTLNLALQHVALARKLMEPDYEDMLKGKNTLAEVRKVLQEENPGLRDALRDSMEQPIKILCDRFQAMKIKERSIGIGFAATTDDINNTLSFVQFLEPSIDSEKSMTSKIINESEPLRKFIETHCNMSDYVFQVKKCMDNSCLHCAHHPVRMSKEDFQSLCYLPLPLLDPQKESFLPFNELYGQKPSDKDQPTKGSYSHQEAKELDSKRKSLLINGKVRRTITCRECFKPRCIYASQKLNKHETALLVELDDSRLYTCGSHLFPPSSSHYESIVVRPNNMKKQKK